MGEILDWNTEGSGETEIGKFEDSFTVNKKILWLQISVENLMFMALGGTIKKLIQERL